MLFLDADDGTDDDENMEDLDEKGDTTSDQRSALFS